MFPSWEDAVNASREISQGEFGLPGVYRISDPEETETGLKLYGIHGTLVEKFITKRGYEPGKRCLCIGTTEGAPSYSKTVLKHIKKIARQYGAMNLTGYAAQKWEHSRYKDPYLREDLNDYGIIIDTLESGVTWDNLHRLHEGVRKYIKARPGTVCMTHASHFYPQGTNLYFIFFGKFSSLDDYILFHKGIIAAIQEYGGSLSHHHGVGKMIGPFMESHLGKEQMDVLRALKRHFDPHNIMNPGGTLGLD